MTACGATAPFLKIACGVIAPLFIYFILCYLFFAARAGFGRTRSGVFERRYFAAASRGQ
jgi:hypothetical protein